jgi:hypothetical protein
MHHGVGHRTGRFGKVDRIAAEALAQVDALVEELQ